jgi:calcineurin-like phosphoesterase
MNKQIVIAGLLGSALGATACDDPFVEAAKLKKAAREADKIAFAADLVALEALAAKEATAYTTALGRVTAQ